MVPAPIVRKMSKVNKKLGNGNQKYTQKRRRRPQKIWNITVGQMLKKRILSWEETRRAAKNNNKWKTIAHQAPNWKKKQSKLWKMQKDAVTA